MKPSPKFLVVVFDGLCVDDISEAQMPNLHSLRRAGCWLSNQRSVFPTETRVNAASLATGSSSGDHGIVANAFVDRQFDPDQLLDGGDLRSLEQLDRTPSQRCLTATSFAEVLAAEGLAMLSVGAQSSGAWGLLHGTRESPGHLGFWCPDPLRHASGPRLERLASKYPRFQSPDVSAAESCARVGDVFLDLAAEGELPAVSLIWFAEPDVSYHYHGLGSTEAREALRQADRQFGRILAWWDGKRRQEDLQIVVASDHGHISVKEQVSLEDWLRAAGFAVGPDFRDAADLALSCGRLGDIWVRGKDPIRARDAFQSLQEAPWFGLGFSARQDAHLGWLPGTFSHESVAAAHPRAPDIRVMFAHDDESNAFGVAGRGYSDGPIGVGGSMHGGLHPKELRAVGLCAGTLFRSGHDSKVHSSIADFAPTMLACLGLERPATMRGRVLSEVLADREQPGPIVGPCPISLTQGAGRVVLHRTRVGDRIYLDAAELAEGAAEKSGWPSLSAAEL